MLIAILLCFAHAQDKVSSDVKTDHWIGRDSMSGYRFKDYSDFYRTWKLVTVRYREDSHEMRLTYANPLAWKTLTSGKTDYSDGAIFAKIAYRLGNDPIFTSSLVPQASKHYQLMVRNKKKHASTDGWGYALFGSEGRTLAGDPTVAVQACAACHKVAASRGYVFSQLAPFAPGPEGEADGNAGAGVAFETLAVAGLPAEVVGALPKGTAQVRSVVGDLRDHLFAGTLDEIKPSLEEEALRSRLPAVLMSRDGKKFSLMLVGGDSQCAVGTQAMTSIFTNLVGDQEGVQNIVRRSHCH